MSGGNEDPGERGPPAGAEEKEADNTTPEERGGWGTGAGPPNSALAYDSEGERMKALAPKTDAEILMEGRKLKAQKMLAKKPGTTLNPRKVCCMYSV